VPSPRTSGRGGEATAGRGSAGGAGRGGAGGAGKGGAGKAGRGAAVRYAATAGPHRVRRNALSTMVGAAQNLGSPTHAH
jgi:hypothetical protein